MQFVFSYGKPSCVRLFFEQTEEEKVLLDCHRATDNWEKRIIRDIQEEECIN